MGYFAGLSSHERGLDEVSLVTKWSRLKYFEGGSGHKALAKKIEL